MINMENTVFYIGHTENSTQNRIDNYTALKERVSKVLPELDSSTVSFKSFDDAPKLKEEFPFLSMKQTIHPILIHYTGEAMSDVDGNMYVDSPFPRWSGEIGLLLTIYKACVRLLESDKEYLLWLEDDTTISSNFETLFPFLCSFVDFRFDFISLSILPYQHKFYESKPEFYSIGSDVYCKVYQLHWAGSILISRRGAAKFLAEAEKRGFEYPFDWLIFNIRSNVAPIEYFDSFALQPWVFSPFGLNTDIQPDSTIYYSHTFSAEDFS